MPYEDTIVSRLQGYADASDRANSQPLQIRLNHSMDLPRRLLTRAGTP